jgi:hypothetical protein
LRITHGADAWDVFQRPLFIGGAVGLCQWGARGLAEAGYGWREILSHYFPAAEVRRLN